MSEELGVVVGLETLELTRSGTLVGTIWLTVAEREFPDVGWYDFPAALVPAWMHSLQKLSTKASWTEVFNFMEGPFYYLMKVESGAYSVELFERDVPVSSPMQVDEHSFRESVLEACRGILTISTARGWKTHDLDQLARIAARLDY